MKSYADFVAYFRHLAAANKKLKDFVVGNSERILNRTTTDIAYPCFWLEDPEITFERDDDTGIYFDAAFVVLINSPAGDWMAEDYNLEACFQVAKEVINRMRSDSQEGVFEIEGQIVLDRVHTLTTDNDWGWRANFRLRIDASNCPDACQWDAACPAGALAAFSYTNSTPGSFLGLSITNETQPDEHGWDYLWRWKKDGSDEQSSLDKNLEISELGQWLYLRLTATGPDGCVRDASAFISSADNCGRSVPYCYNPARYHPGWADTGLGWSDTDGLWTDSPT